MRKRSKLGGVEIWCGAVGGAYLLAGPFVCRCLTSPTVFRFHIPLIKQDVRISRIRLPDKVSRVRPREAACHRRQPDELQRLVQVGVRVA